MSLDCLTFSGLVFLEEKLIKMEPQSQSIVTYEYLKNL